MYKINNLYVLLLFNLIAYDSIYRHFENGS